ncbi:MAG TPA: hypothetical protein VIK86_01760 [Candidatus Paceibacterota bacterium]
MELKQHPWRDCKRMRLLNILYVPIVGFVGIVPAILIMFSLKSNYMVLPGILYFFLILKGYLFLTRYTDKKLEKKWLEENF